MKTILFMIFLLTPSLAFSAINFTNGKWETTFDCTEQTQGSFSCDGLSNYGAWTCSDGGGGHGDIITSAANNPNGSGGLGFRHFQGDGINNLGGGISAAFSTPQSELWVRATIRYGAGFSWSGAPYYDKLFYAYSDASSSSSNAAIWGIQPAGPGKWGIVRQGPSGTPFTGTVGWNDTYPNGDSDGSWFTMEVHIKLDTVIGGVSKNNGIVAMWIDGAPVGYDDSYSWTAGDSSITGWPKILIGSNQKTVNSGSCIGVDFDDVVIYNTTPPNTDSAGHPFIGPLANSGVTIPPTTGVTTPPTGISTSSTLLLAESFEDNSWTSRGWYDGTNSTGTAAGGYSGNALRWQWTTSATQPTGFSTLRHNLSSAATEFQIEYYVKYESGWQGSGRAYHPHLMHILSTADTAYQGLSRANSNLYFESLTSTSAPYTIHTQFAHQDYVRTSTSYGTPPQNLVNTTETRSANQCNTPYGMTNATLGTCYSDGSGWYSANVWTSDTVNIPTDTWTKITTYVKKNTFANGVGNFDGVIRVWVGDKLAIESTTVLYATNAYSDTAWNKLVLAPYIGDGSPTNQTMWLDELSVRAINPGAPTPPTGLRLIQ